MLLSSATKEFVFGVQPVVECLKSEQDVERVLIQKNLTGDQIKGVMMLATKMGVPVQKVPVEKLNRVTRKIHQGVICYISAVQYASLDNVLQTAYERGEAPLILVLDQITDVRNFGAIARTAECAGVHGIVIPDKGGAQIGADAMKTSSGALNHIPICRTPRLTETVKFLKESGLQVVGCTEKAEDSLYDASFVEPLAIVMGSEESGISPDIRRLCSAEVKIPLHGKVGSMNVSVATAVVTYEALRQRIKENASK